MVILGKGLYAINTKRISLPKQSLTQKIKKVNLKIEIQNGCNTPPFFAHLSHYFNFKLHIHKLRFGGGY